MTLSLSKLQECAERATPGPWLHVKDSGQVCIPIGEPIDGLIRCTKAIAYTDFDQQKIPVDAPFIASMNPQTALALIRVARFAKRVIKAGGMDCDAIRELTESMKGIEP